MWAEPMQHDWVDRRTGEVINVDRAVRRSDVVMAERALEADLLAAASKAVTGKRVWLALRIGQCGEIAMRDWLIERQVDAVVPVKEVRSAAHRGRRAKVIHKPVLRGLVFVNLVVSLRACAGLLRVRGVTAIVGKGGEPYPIRDKDMNEFMDKAQKGAFDERMMASGLKVGSRVKVTLGGHAYIEGVLAGYVGSRAGRVRTWLFGAEMTVDVKLAHLGEAE